MALAAGRAVRVGRMTLAHAHGFLAIGVVLRFVPFYFFWCFSPDTGQDTCASELWLRFMGWVNVWVGLGGVFFWQAGPWLARVLAWHPDSLEDVVPDLGFAPCRQLDVGLDYATLQQALGCA